MFGLRRFIKTRRSSSLLALWIAYSLGIQAVMASIGLGMSALAAPAPDGFVVCSHAPRDAQIPTGDRHSPGPEAPCPFCFVAAQSAGHAPLLVQIPAVPVHLGLPIAALSARLGEARVILRFARMVGDPRAPPAFSA